MANTYLTEAARRLNNGTGQLADFHLITIGDIITDRDGYWVPA